MFIALKLYKLKIYGISLKKHYNVCKKNFPESYEDLEKKRKAAKERRGKSKKQATIPAYLNKPRMTDAQKEELGLRCARVICGRVMLPLQFSEDWNMQELILFVNESIIKSRNSKCCSFL
eukprot:g11212.t1